jgi:hypothetical protein
VQRKFCGQIDACGSVHAIGVQRPSRQVWPEPQLVAVQGGVQLPAAQTWPLGHCVFC